MQICTIYALYLTYMQKDIRQNAIIDLIHKENISTQDELTILLVKNGFSVNQSSVSRDLVEIGIVKLNGFYTVPSKTNYSSFGLISLEIAGESLIVAKTENGFAGAVCVRIDNAKIAEVVGTIAGEDTIFIAVRNQKEQRIVLKKVWEMFEN
jgi:transcriptional regulator of arginine metabolism